MSLTVRERASPNFGPRRDGRRPDTLILHYTGTETAEAALRWLCLPESEVSCHYLVDEAGTITRLVAETERAWHAGVSYWMGETDINSSSVGIEIHNPGHTLGYDDFPDQQMRAVIGLCQDVLARHAIRPQRVLAHSDVAPFRKIDPGERFDWHRLWRHGIGHWGPPAPIRAGASLMRGTAGPEVERLQLQLRAYGYGLEATRVYDRETATVVSAFQRHFRPALVDGCADPSTRDTLERLLAALPP